MLQALLEGDVERATALAARLQDIFGRESLFVELQDHGLRRAAADQPRADPPGQAHRRSAAGDQRQPLRVPLTTPRPTTPCSACRPGSVKDDPKRFKFHGDEHYLKTAAEMRHLFRDYPEACDNTLWIAERADVEIEFGKPKLPSFPRPDGFADADAYLRHLAYRGGRRSATGTRCPPRSSSGSTTSSASSPTWGSPTTSSSSGT